MKVPSRERDWDRYAVQVRSALPRGGRCEGVVEVGIIRVRVPRGIVFSGIGGVSIAWLSCSVNVWLFVVKLVMILSSGSSCWELALRVWG